MEKGKLVRWNADKGFGFIKPDSTANKDIFIHISILKHMARKPVVGDQINYFSETQSDGKVKAIKANIEGVAVISSRKSNRVHHRQDNRKSSSGMLIPLLVILVLGIFGFQKYKEMTATPVLTNKDIEQMEWQPTVQNSNPITNQPTFRCEVGKTHCSHMSSCAEATFYNNNCPGTKMDGDDDGIPCESQWCSRY
ncbi:excalibur calcium-binding domain-containing protein [Shewanella sp. 1_MG-2023]|uniref:excalibur calcium-binding domain-containing protein n=1 Tax=unclassified Shewanella TaxID=196818 RepID=UPI0026E3D432|nr:MULTISPECIES: excalibur calcium-binding domain-containing protein [unclassified Shewanella]MDO6610654.1 excalibur calcium-binding domain-containing protein [Shewanella sp. 7_MG-2023]MDO6770779.1 excalibur calcium-binding domain-containing protein [Shewanella sp. 2_MG-2023]MDO6793203.1 excalibur calcium-binding domain-containing protein [Shewanella sp. 1_MG-2023]